MPAATATNIDKITAGDCVNANPRAVPRNGAVHGVASTVAKRPWKNEPKSSLRSAVESKRLVMVCGSEISNTPKRFRAKTSTMMLSPRKKYAFVNWNPPQVTSRPVSLSAIRSNARAMNHAKMPAVKARPLRRIFFRLCPACLMKPKILSEITGSTHGIKFKMKPPMKPKNKNLSRPRLAIGGPDDATSPAPESLQAARSSAFGREAKTSKPGRDDSFLSALCSGILKVISSPLRDSTDGCPTRTFAGGAGKKSVAGYLASVALFTCKRRSEPLPRLHFTVATFSPGQFCGSNFL